MNDSEDAAANALGRIFAGIGECERLLGAKTEAGDEAADHQQGHAWRQRTEDGEDAEQQKIELIDEAAAEPVGQFALAGGAQRDAENGGAADQRRVCRLAPMPDLMMNGTSEPKTVKSMTSQKYPAAISAITRLCSGEIFASSRAALT